MVYKSDASSIRDAQDTLADKVYDQKVQDLEDAIDAIDDQIDALDDKIDELNDALDLQTDALDKQIDALNDYKDKWDEIADSWQNAQNASIANQILGDGWEDQILALDTTPIEDFKNAYVGAQDQMALANEKAAEAAVTAAQEELAAAQSASSGTQNAVAGAINSFGSYIDILGGDDDESTSSSGSIYTDEQNFSTGKITTKKPGGATLSSTSKKKKSTSLTGAVSSASEAIDEMNDSISDTSDVIPEVKTSLEEFDKALDTDSGKLTSNTTAINKRNEALLKQLAILDKLNGTNYAETVRNDIQGGKYKIFGSGSSYATGSNGLKSAQEALTSEYGQAEMIVTPDGHWQITNEPTLQKLPKGTVIYDGDQTERLLKGKAYSTGTGATITPLAEADGERFKMFSDVSAMLVNTNSISVGLKDISKSLAQISAEVTPKTQGGNTAQQVTFGNITVNCPGVTEAEVAKNLPSALQNAFSGLALNAYQQSMKR